MECGRFGARAHVAPLSLSAAGRRPDATPLSPFDNAALETLQVEVVVPVRSRGELTAFVCLGRKRSGDIYTGTDLALLSAVSDKMATQMERLGE